MKVVEQFMNELTKAIGKGIGKVNIFPLAQMFGGTDTSGPVVVTNTNAAYGAELIIREETWQEIADRFGKKDWYILPSSIHEVIIVPKNLGPSAKDFMDMVRTINATSVAPKDRLSDTVYMYDSDANEIVMAN